MPNNENPSAQWSVGFGFLLTVVSMDCNAQTLSAERRDSLMALLNAIGQIHLTSTTPPRVEQIETMIGITATSALDSSETSIWRLSDPQHLLDTKYSDITIQTRITQKGEIEMYRARFWIARDPSQCVHIAELQAIDELHLKPALILDGSPHEKSFTNQSPFPDGIGLAVDTIDGCINDTTKRG